MRKHAFAAVVLVGCHSVLLKIERRGSAGIVDMPIAARSDFFDGHAMPFPAKPFTNRVDLLPRGAAPACLKASAGFRGYAFDQVLAAKRNAMPVWMRNASLREELYAARTLVAACTKPVQAPATAPVTTTATATTTATTATAEGVGAQVEGESISLTLRVDPADATRLTKDLVITTADGRAALALAQVTGDCGSGCMKVDLAARGHPPSGAVLVYAAASAPTHLRLPSTVLSFVQFSDAQIREPAATLGGQQVSDQLDPIIPSFAHDYDQELYSAFVYDAVVQTVNKEIDAATAAKPRHVEGYRRAPQLMIHTGDSIDAGLVSEFTEFLVRSDGLDIPWYSVIGNHDILGFGNLDVRSPDTSSIACTSTTTLLREYHIAKPRGDGLTAQTDARRRVNDKEFAWAPFALKRVCLDLRVDGNGGDRLLPAPVDENDGRSPIQRFVDAHCRGNADATETCGVPPNLPDYAPRACTTPPCYSQRNGFDLEPGMPGYYVFEAPNDYGAGNPDWGERRIWIVVLNTSNVPGAYGVFDTMQKEWLRKLLFGEAPANPAGTRIDRHKDLVLVFAHHPIWGIESPDEREGLVDLLLEAGNVPAFFAGHTHYPALRRVESPKRSGAIWEVVAASTIGFPQQARQVTVKVIPGTHVAYLEVLTFEPHLEAAQQAHVLRANRGAERDHCDQYPDECKNGRPLAPNTGVIFTRLFFELPQQPRR